MKRALFLLKPIKAEAVNKICEDITNINKYDTEQELIEKDYQRRIINLYTNYTADDILKNSNLVSIVRESKTPVHTIQLH